MSSFWNWLKQNYDTRQSGDDLSIKCPFCGKPGYKLGFLRNGKGNCFHASCGWKSGSANYSIRCLLGVSKYEASNILRQNARSTERIRPNNYVNYLLPDSHSVLNYSEPRDYLHSRGITDVLIKKFNLLYCVDEDNMHNNRIIIPMYDSRRILEFYISRGYKDGTIKYLTPENWFSKKGSFLYYYWETPIKKNIILVEGAFDVIVKHSDTLNTTYMAVNGTVISREQVAKVLSLNPEKILIWFDNNAIYKAEEYCNMFRKKWGQDAYYIESDEDPKSAKKITIRR